MRITLKVAVGPNQGLEFSFARHDTFLVGRSDHAHFQLPKKDKYCSRIHFLIEVNPPQCRLIDMGSHNGTFVNGQRVLAVDLKHGDEIRAGHTVLGLTVERTPGAAVEKPAILAPAGPVADLPPDRFPGYRLERALGRGRMGAQHLATRLTDGVTVALKSLAPAHAGSREQVEQFLRELRPLRELEHPSIARLLDAGEADGLLYVVSEYVHGSSLAELLRDQGPSPVEQAARLVAQALRALEYAHARGVVHRDIKPSNIVLLKEGKKVQVKFADFGLARVYQESPLSGLTITGEPTVAFMAPEQITNYRQAAPASDQYAAAAVLYALLTGKDLYDFPTEMPLQFSLLLSRQPVAIRLRRADVSEPLAAVIHKALQRKPENRFRDVGAFRRALVRAVVDKEESV